MKPRWVLALIAALLFSSNALAQNPSEAIQLLSEADWNLMARDNIPADLKPKKDMVATDGGPPGTTTGQPEILSLSVTTGSPRFPTVVSECADAQVGWMTAAK